MAHRLICSAIGEIFPDQGSNPCLGHLYPLATGNRILQGSVEHLHEFLGFFSQMLSLSCSGLRVKRNSLTYLLSSKIQTTSVASGACPDMCGYEVCGFGDQCATFLWAGSASGLESGCPSPRDET